MKPYPFASLNHFTVPLIRAITISSFSPGSGLAIKTFPGHAASARGRDMTARATPRERRARRTKGARWAYLLYLL